jgi:hypothetical protein
MIEHPATGFQVESVHSIWVSAMTPPQGHLHKIATRRIWKMPCAVALIFATYITFAKAIFSVELRLQAALWCSIYSQIRMSACGAKQTAFGRRVEVRQRPKRPAEAIHIS